MVYDTSPLGKSLLRYARACELKVTRRHFYFLPGRSKLANQNPKIVKYTIQFFYIHIGIP